MHEAYLRLVGDGSQNWDGWGHFFAAAAEAMRRILVEGARRKRNLKRGGGQHRVCLYFTTLIAGTYDNWRSPIIPIVDFNGDGKVDGKEVLDIVEHWDQNESLYDIGPAGLGDGIVDTNDLIVLADYTGTEWNDPTLLAYWAFEEGAGNVALDWVGRHDAMIAGEVESGNAFRDDWCKGLRAVAQLKGLKRRIVVYPRGPVLQTQDIHPATAT